MQWHAGREHARGVPQRVQADIVDAQSLGRGADRPQCVPGVDCRPALRGENEARLNPDRDGASSRSTAWLALTDRNSATVAGERGTSQKPTSEPRAQPARRAGWSHNWQPGGPMLMAGGIRGGRLRGLRWEARVHATVAAGLIRTLTCADVEGGRQWSWTLGPLRLSSVRGGGVWAWNVQKGCHISANKSRQGWTPGACGIVIAPVEVAMGRSLSSTRA